MIRLLSWRSDGARREARMVAWLQSWWLTTLMAMLGAGMGLTGGAAKAATPIKDWTVMVYMNGDNDLEPWALRNYLQMAKVGSTEQVNIVCQFDRVPGYAGATPDYDDWTQTLRFYVTKNGKPMSKQALADMGELDMGDPATLRDFVGWARSAYPAKKYMLIIWNHGQGWRYFETVTIPIAMAPRMAKLRMQLPMFNAVSREKQETQSRQLWGNLQQKMSSAEWDALEASRSAPMAAEIPLDHAVHGSIRYVSSDSTARSHLYNSAIQEVLEGMFQTNQLDVIGYDACLMSMVETAYAMRRACRVMVASEELEPAKGWQYATWLAELTAKPEMDAEALARLIVESYAKQFEGFDAETTLSATRMDGVDQLAKNISVFAEAAMRVLPKESERIREARYQCYNYAQGFGLHGIDLGRFVQQLLERVADAELQASGKAVLKQLDKMLVANYAGEERRGGFGSSGLAIYFPHTKTAFLADPDRGGYEIGNTNHPVEFVRSQKWAKFLAAYYNFVTD